MIATWNYCTFTHRALAVFAFNLFDADNSGQLEKFEIEELVSAVYGDSVNNNERIKRVLDQLDGNDDGCVSREEWLLFNRSQPLLLFPAYQMQEALRSRIIGTYWWHAMQEKRSAQFRQKVFVCLFVYFPMHAAPSSRPVHINNCLLYTSPSPRDRG